MSGNLDHERAALSRLATGKSFADDVSVLRMALDRLAALSAPPADDVREALALAIREGRRNKINARVEWANDDTDEMPYPDRQEDDYVADAIFAALEVRPRGTVTDAEVEAAWLAWDAVSVDDDPNGWLSIRAALEAAREARS